MPQSKKCLDIATANESATSNPTEVAAACPLCRQSRIDVVEQLNGRQLRALWQELGRKFTSDAWGMIHEQFVVKMQKCQNCGFVFFEPSLAGNEALYRELEHEAYYCPERNEFGRTVGFAKRKGLRRVMDVGCGSGAFLDLALRAGCETCGLELNSAAAEKARAKGHKIFSKLLYELDINQTSGGFDLITLFQVLEHVSDPVTVMKQAATFLNPCGYISIAVPSDEGICLLDPWDPHQWPPHHVSRWRSSDLEQLAHAAQLTVVEKGGDILLGSGILELWKMHNRLAPVLGKPVRFGGDWLPEVISFVYRKTGMKFLFPARGSSIYAYFKRR